MVVFHGRAQSRHFKQRRPNLSRMLAKMPTNDFSFRVPQISSDELLEFHQSHFSNEAAADFGQSFTNLPPQEVSEDQPYEEWGEEDEEDDGLGYYEDGVKRTLTDAQIEIFRHSELRELKRQREKQAQAKSGTPRDASANETHTASPHDPGTSTTSRSKKKKKKKSKAVKQEPKPDLRKRTWDVVEAGLDSLDYD